LITLSKPFSQKFLFYEVIFLLPVVDIIGFVMHVWKKAPVKKLKNLNLNFIQQAAGF
jgi:hypothetical protein